MATLVDSPVASAAKVSLPESDPPSPKEAPTPAEGSVVKYGWTKLQPVTEEEIDDMNAAIASLGVDSDDDVSRSSIESVCGTEQKSVAVDGTSSNESDEDGIQIVESDDTKNDSAGRDADFSGSKSDVKSRDDGESGGDATAQGSFL